MRRQGNTGRPYHQAASTLYRANKLALHHEAAKSTLHVRSGTGTSSRQVTRPRTIGDELSKATDAVGRVELGSGRATVPKLHRRRHSQRFTVLAACHETTYNPDEARRLKL